MSEDGEDLGVAMMKFVTAVSIAGMMAFSQWAVAHPGHNAPVIYNDIAGGASGVLVTTALVTAVGLLALTWQRRKRGAKQRGAHPYDYFGNKATC